jgi:anti-sigma factor (TIGR02949 family)
MTRTEITTCAEALRVLAAHLDRELDEHERSEVERHLATCRSCFSRAEFERRLKEGVKGLGSEPVRPELADRITNLIQEFTTAAGDGPRRHLGG